MKRKCVGYDLPIKCLLRSEHSMEGGRQVVGKMSLVSSATHCGRTSLPQGVSKSPLGSPWLGRLRRTGCGWAARRPEARLGKGSPA